MLEVKRTQSAVNASCLMPMGELKEWKIKNCTRNRLSYWLTVSLRSSWISRGSRSPPWPRGACLRTRGHWGSHRAQAVRRRIPSIGHSTSHRRRHDSSLYRGPPALGTLSAPILELQMGLEFLKLPSSGWPGTRTERGHEVNSASTCSVKTDLQFIASLAFIVLCKVHKMNA